MVCGHSVAQISTLNGFLVDLGRIDVHGHVHYPQCTGASKKFRTLSGAVNQANKRLLDSEARRP